MKLFTSVCEELVPEHILDLKDELNDSDPVSLYRFWPSAKRVRKALAITLPTQASRRGRDRAGGLPVVQ